MRGNPAGTLADIVMLVRYALGQTESLEPLSSLVAGRFNLWLGREEKAGRVYSDEQRAWLPRSAITLASTSKSGPRI